MEIHTPCSQIGRLNAKMDTPQIPLQMQHNPYQNLPDSEEPNLRGKKLKNRESLCMVFSGDDEMGIWWSICVLKKTENLFNLTN